MNVFVMIWIAQPSLLRHLLIIIREYPVNKLDLNADYQIKNMHSAMLREQASFQ
jgi:hypothetical protein